MRETMREMLNNEELIETVMEHLLEHLEKSKIDIIQRIGGYLTRKEESMVKDKLLGWKKKEMLSTGFDEEMRIALKYFNDEIIVRLLNSRLFRSQCIPNEDEIPREYVVLQMEIAELKQKVFNQKEEIASLKKEIQLDEGRLERQHKKSEKERNQFLYTEHMFQNRLETLVESTNVFYSEFIDMYRELLDNFHHSERLLQEHFKRYGNMNMENDWKEILRSLSNQKHGLSQLRKHSKLYNQSLSKLGFNESFKERIENKKLKKAKDKFARIERQLSETSSEYQNELEKVRRHLDIITHNSRHQRMVIEDLSSQLERAYRNSSKDDGPMEKSKVRKLQKSSMKRKNSRKLPRLQSSPKLFRQASRRINTKEILSKMLELSLDAQSPTSSLQEQQFCDSLESVNVDGMKTRRRNSITETNKTPTNKTRKPIPPKLMKVEVKTKNEKGNPNGKTNGNETNIIDRHRSGKRSSWIRNDLQLPTNCSNIYPGFLRNDILKKINEIN